MIDDGNFQVFSILVHTRILLLFLQTNPRRKNGSTCEREQNREPVARKVPTAHNVVNSFRMRCTIYPEYTLVRISRMKYSYPYTAYSASESPGCARFDYYYYFNLYV